MLGSLALAIRSDSSKVMSSKTFYRNPFFQTWNTWKALLWLKIQVLVPPACLSCVDASNPRIKPPWRLLPAEPMTSECKVDQENLMYRRYFMQVYITRWLGEGILLKLAQNFRKMEVENHCLSNSPVMSYQIQLYIFILSYSWSSVPQVRMNPSAIPRSQYSPPWCHASLVDGNDPASFRLSFLDGPASSRKHLWVVPLIYHIG